MKVSVANSDIIRLALPISLALLIPQINFFTNTAFLGRLGEVELGVNGIAGIFYLTLSMIGYGLNSGIQVQMARRAGEGDQAGLTKVLTNGVMLCILFSLSLMMLSLWLAPLIFGTSLSGGENVYLSINFLFIRVWGLPFLMLTQLINAFYIATGRSRFLMYGSAVGTLFNIVFDYLLIFGHAGFPEMGLEGAAAASILAEMAYCGVMYGIFFAKKYYDRYPVWDHVRFDGQLSKRILKVSSPLIVQYLFSIGGWQVFFIFVEHLGQQELAASQILRSVFGIVSIVTWAFAATCNTMVSNIMGQGRQEEVVPLIGRIAKISLIGTSIIVVLLLAMSGSFISLYRDDPSLVNLAVPSLRMIAVSTLIMAVSTVVFNGVVGTGNTLVNLTIEITCVCIYLVYCYIVIERLRSPLHWAWASEFVYWFCLLGIGYWYLRSGRWKGKRI